ncbi:MAG: osmotically inducible protein [Thermomicrobiales bacterium]|nr:osmotically inducible protein [Thermomicrobiales bacterium]
MLPISGCSDQKSKAPSGDDRQSKRKDLVGEGPFVASVTVTHVPGTTYQTRIDTGDLALIGDEPVESGGDGLGPNPYELLLAALGQCTVLTILLYARRKGWPVDGVSVRANHERLVVAEEFDGELIRKKVERIVQEIALQGNLDEVQRARLIEIAGKCPVHRTLSGDLEILEREVGVDAAAPTERTSVFG